MGEIFWEGIYLSLFSPFRPKVILTEARSSREHIYLLFANLVFDGLLPAVLFSTLLLGFFFLPESRTGRLRFPAPSVSLFLDQTSFQKSST